MDKNIKKDKMSTSLPIRLKIGRLGRGYKSRSTFANACGVAITTYRAHERGDYEPKASDLIKYTDTLDVSIPWLLTGRGHPLDHLAQPDADVLAQFLYYVHLEDSKAQIKESASQAVKRILDT